ncbi:monothiol glutaredoxin grx5 [Entophlyctis luteolus]|nr:monothiol glutaredoxin grx5 [Entophlyctis luteolus]
MSSPHEPQREVLTGCQKPSISNNAVTVFDKMMGDARTKLAATVQTQLHTQVHTIAADNPDDNCPVCGIKLVGVLAPQDQERHLRICLGDEEPLKSPAVINSKRSINEPPCGEVKKRKIPIIGTTYIVSKYREATGNRECDICMEEFEFTVPIATLNCLCIFHETCKYSVVLLGIERTNVTSSRQASKTGSGERRTAQHIFEIHTINKMLRLLVPCGQKFSASVRCARAPLNARYISDDLRGRIEKALTAHDVLVFMKGTKEAPQCGFSRAVVQVLNSQGVKFSTVNVLADEEVRNGIKEFSSWPTIPQVYVKGEFVGGCDIMVSMMQSGELTRLLVEKGLLPASAVDEKQQGDATSGQ